MQTTTRISLAAVTAAVVAIAGLVRSAACAETSSAKAPPATAPPAEASKSLPPLPKSDAGRRLPLDQKAPFRWVPIRPQVTITSKPTAEATTDGTSADPGEGAALKVDYHRARSTASGVAFPLPAFSLDGMDAVTLTLGATPDMRILVTLTDAEGVVWAFSPIRAGAQATESVLALDELRPDRWQNAGKTIPATPTLASMKLLTVLDISGHMGAAEVDCTWTIDSIELRAADAAGSTGAPDSSGAARSGGSSEPDTKKSSTPANGADSTRSGTDGAGASAENAGAGSGASFVEAQNAFFDALQRNPQRRDEAIAMLDAAVAARPDAGRPALLLGAAHLWASGDTATPEAEVLGHLRLAEASFARAMELMPEDERISSWFHSSRYFIAVREGRLADAERERALLRAVTDQDPGFHSVAFGVISFDEARDSAAFTDAVTFARRGFASARSGDSVITNGSRWPFTTQGYLVGYADLLARAGDLAGAEDALIIADARSETATWPHRALIDERLDTLRDRVARWSDDSPTNDPAFAWAARSATSCVICHAAAR